MAETKKKTQRKSTSSPAKKSTGGRPSGSTKRKPTKKQIAKKKEFIRGEVVAIAVVFAALFQFLSTLGLLGTAGDWVGGVMKGLFGALSYVFPVAVLISCGYAVSKKNEALFGLKLAALILFFFLVSGLVQLLFGTKETEPLREIFRAAKEGAFLHEGAGGFFGAAISQGISAVFGRTGAYLILFLLLLIAFVILTEKSIVKLMERGVEKTADAARTGTERARVRFDEERVRLDARREEARLRKKEKQFTKAVTEDLERGRQPVSLSSFDLKKERAESMSGFGSDLTGEEENQFVSLPEGTYREKEPERTAENVLPYGEPAEVPVPAEPDYDVDDVPFMETEEDRYKAYGRILAGGTIDIASAKNMGFAVSKGITPVPGMNREAEIPSGILPEVSVGTDAGTLYPAEETLQERIPETTEEDFLDEEYEPEEGEDNLHDPLSPDEMNYPEPGEGPEEENDEIFPDEEKQSEEPAPEFIEQEFKRKHIEERTPIHVSMGVPEEPAGFGADKILTPEKAAKKSPEEAQKELDQKRQAEKENLRKKVVRPYRFPPVELLTKGKKSNLNTSEETRENSRKLEDVLRSFGVGVTVTNVVVGPRVTRYEMTPDIGVKVSKITSLAGDIKLALAAKELRIEAPIPGKSAVGIEIPNRESVMVTFRDIMDTDTFKNSRAKLPWGVGLDIQGAPVVGDISKMPHLLVSGTTGSGKSVGINSIIMSVIYRQKPEDVKMILVDPKVVELSVYDGIPHLLAPVVTKPEQAINVLKQACAEMNQRYRLFKESNTRNIKGYNEKVEEVSKTLPPEAEKPEKMPYILIIIDELAELMMHSKKDVEDSIVSLTQLARAAGIHLVVATQRPSVDVVTGLIKSNIPSRVAYRLPSLIDSRTVLDQGGAETLLGYGDMLYKLGDMNSPLRIQGAFMEDEEVAGVVEWLKKHNSCNYSDEWETAMNAVPASSQDGGGAGFDSAPKMSDDGKDAFFYEAGDLITDKKKASIGMLQRKFKIGFNRAARIMEQLSDEGVVSEGEGTKERQILMTNMEFREKFGNG